MSSEKGLSHPTISVTFDRGKLFEIVWTLSSIYLVKFQKLFLGRTKLQNINISSEFKLCIVDRCVPKASNAQGQPKRICYIQLFWLQLMEGNYLGVSEHYQICIVSSLRGSLGRNKAIGHKYLFRIKTVHCWHIFGHKDARSTLHLML